MNIIINKNLDKKEIIKKIAKDRGIQIKTKYINTLLITSTIKYTQVQLKH